MNAIEPTREQAAAALAEATNRATQVQRADSQLRWMLLAILAAYAVAAVLMSFASRRGTALAPIGIVAALITALVFCIVVWLRIRAYSRFGIRAYFATILAFNLWNAVVVSTSIATGFWSHGQPAFHFGISEALGGVPLLLGVVLIGRRP